MFSKKRTLFDEFSLTVKKAELPLDCIIDKIMLHMSVTVSNAGASEWSGTYADVLAKLNELRVVSDGNNVHYAINFLDAVIMNFYDEQGVGVNPDTAVTIAASGNETLNFLVTLDQGDILALSKQSLDISIGVDTAVATDVTITALTGKITLEEHVVTAAELVQMYGQNLEMSAEPKVTTIVKSFAVSQELREFLELPTGTALRKTFLVVMDGSDVRAGVTPDKFGVIKTTPGRQEQYAVEYSTMREFNKRLCNLPTLINGVVTMDYGAEITNDVWGIKGWTFKPGDYQLAVKSASAGKVRYISIEYVVNTTAYARAMQEAT